MEFRLYEADEYTVLFGHVRVIDGESYGNLQFVDADCLDCSSEERRALKCRGRVSAG